MKLKNILLLILFLIVAGSIFWFGWIRADLEENTYGIVYTKTGGYRDTILKPGIFFWSLEGLIPKNVKVITFPLIPQRFNLSTGGLLPSGDVYGIYLEGNPDFSWTIDLSVTFIIKPDSLLDLVENKGLTRENLDTWYSDFANLCLSHTLSLINETIYGTSPSDRLSQSLSTPGETPNLFQLNKPVAQHLAEEFPQVDFIQVLLNNSHFPDPELYSEGRKQYFAMLELKKKAAASSMEESAAEQFRESTRLEILQRYGKLLSEYPVLVDYLSLSSEERDILIRKNLPELLPEED
ncbi:MAG: hypothetical protein KAU17_06525 [Spirochaetales bacterium]|nr:hypothetical protein [Spirochaetales bacterium]